MCFHRAVLLDWKKCFEVIYPKVYTNSVVFWGYTLSVVVVIVVVVVLVVVVVVVVIVVVVIYVVVVVMVVR